MVSPHKSFHEHDVVQAAASSHLFCLSEVTCQWLVTKYMLAILGCGQCPFTVQMIRQANVNNIYVGISHEIVVVSVETRDPEFSCPIACGLEISASDPGEFCFLIRSPQCGINAVRAIREQPRMPHLTFSVTIYVPQLA